MPHRSLVVLSAVAVLVGVGSATSARQTTTIRTQGSQTPAPPVTGTGGINGIVKSAGTSLPIRGVRIALTGTAAGTGAGVTQFTLSDGAGKFTFNALPAGRFVIAATRAGFLSANYGQKKPGGNATPIDLAEGQRGQADFAMTRGSAITGRVMDDSGEPVVHAQVQLHRFMTNQNGVSRLREANERQTDDRGVYRFFGLEPGEYWVAAVALPPEAEPISDFALSGGDDAGSARDVGTPGAREVAVVNANQEPSEPPFAPTFYPSSSLARGGLSVKVDGFAERDHIDIQLLTVRTGTIRGTVLGMAGVRLPVQVLLHSSDANEPQTPLTANADGDGQFVLPNVPPGPYTVYAQTLPPTREEATTVITVVNGVQVVRGVDPVSAVREAAFERLHGSTELTVTGPDTTPISITLRPGRAISGHVTLELARPPTGAAAQAGTVISIVPSPRQAGLPSFNTSPTARVDADGNFTLPGIRPGRYFLRASGPGTVKSVMLNGLDTLDFPLEVGSEQDVNNVVITLTDRLSELTGIVSDSTGQPGYDCSVLIVSTDSRFWAPGSRRVAVARPGPDGGYSFRGLPPGEYRLGAVFDFEPADQFDPVLLQRLASSGTPVSIMGASRQTQNLRLTR